MPTTLQRPRQAAAVVLGLLLLFAACWLAAPARAGGKEAPADKSKEQRAKDLQELIRVFADNEVTVFSTGQGAVEGVRIAGVVEVFGRRFLHVRAANNRSVLILAEAITAIRQEQ